MQSREHAIVSIVVGALGAWALPLPVSDPVAILYAAVLGVGIDLDHFVIARLRTGNWRALGRCLRDPELALFRQTEIFRDGVVGPQRRLLSHVIISGFLVGAIWEFGGELGWALAALTALVLYTHVLSDLIWDVTREERSDATRVDARSEREEASGSPREGPIN